MGRDNGPLRSEETVYPAPAKARDFGIPEHGVRLRDASRYREEEYRGSAQEDLCHFTLVRSDEGRGEELVGEGGSAVPVEPWYAKPGGVAVEEGLD